MNPHPEFYKVNTNGTNAGQRHIADQTIKIFELKSFIQFYNLIFSWNKIQLAFQHYLWQCFSTFCCSRHPYEIINVLRHPNQPLTIITLIYVTLSSKIKQKNCQIFVYVFLSKIFCAKITSRFRCLFFSHLMWNLQSEFLSNNLLLNHSDVFLFSG